MIKRRRKAQRPVSDDETALFERAMADVSRTPEVPSPPASPKKIHAPHASKPVEPNKRATAAQRKPKMVVHHKPTGPQPAQPDRRGAASGVDRRTAQRLVRGQMSIEGRIDLHGMSQAQARRALERFLADSTMANKRCVLVITGKGSARDSEDGFMPSHDVGVLRRSLPSWLELPGLREKVVAYHAAKPRDGGEGAFYVLLRRRRS